MVKLEDGSLYRTLTAITGIPEDKLTVQYPGEEKPGREGVYARISAKTGEIVFAYYRPGFGWGKYSDTIAHAVNKQNRYSRYQALPWLGVVPDEQPTAQVQA